MMRCLRSRLERAPPERHFEFESHCTNRWCIRRLAATCRSDESFLRERVYLPGRQFSLLYYVSLIYVQLHFYPLSPCSLLTRPSFGGWTYCEYWPLARR